MEGIYKVNLIPSDLSTEETILQIADTLENLNGIVEDVFARLSKRIQNNMNKTTKLKERIDISRSKVEKITGMQKAIKVFSGAKYPASIKHEHYESVFGLDGYNHVSKKAEKLHFYHVKVAQPKSAKPKQDFNLNTVIDSMSTVGELLVFNTEESPYLGTVSKVPSQIPRVVTNVENKSLLEAAPSSIMKRDVLKREADEYMYAPGMGMVPELEMPLDLPHLPGIAGDVQFSLAGDGSIAPSVVTSPVAASAALPEELPDILPDVVEDVKEEVVSEPAPAVRTEKPAPPPAAGDAHSNLMAAIRQAGGAGRAKLRPAAADSPADKPPKSGGDLMADLHAKLSMRRRGISGAERSGGSVLHTLASVIPEPEASSEQQSSSDDDWN
ncbi:WAHD domain of WASH complex domain-containing protein [Phthorimaea operculella]|nr:WAHD domain of WASH complex domain-containing protein [Phthorimaea operculella]